MEWYGQTGRVRFFVNIGPPHYKLWIGGEQVTSDKTSGEGWEFTPAFGSTPAKLILNNATIQCPKDTESHWSMTTSSGIKCLMEELVIELQGDNEIKRPVNAHQYVYGIDGGESADGVNTHITITGNGSLKVDDYHFSATAGVAAIRAEYLIVESGTIYATPGYAGRYSRGVYVDHLLTIKGGNLVAKGYDFHESDEVVGIDTYRIYMYGGRLTAIGRDGAISSYEEPKLSGYKDAYVEVNTETTAEGAYEWNQTDKLGGIYPSFKYVNIGPPRTRYNLWIGGKRVTSANMSGEGWKFTTPNKLTLTDATITAGRDSKYGDHTNGIESQMDLVIELNGTNRIIGTTARCSQGIKNLYYNTTIEGDGSLEVTAADAQMQSYALYLNNLTDESGTITAVGGKGDNFSSGIRCWGKIEINGGNVTATGNTVSSSLYQQPSVGIRSDKTITIKGGSVTATGHTRAISPAPNLNNYANPHVFVNTAASAVGASDWNKADALGGDDSVFKYVNVVPKASVEPKTIEITTAPNRTEYFAGDYFDPTGMVITVTYQDGSTAEAEGYTVYNGGPLTTSQTQVRIDYNERGLSSSVFQPITVKEAKLQSIDVTSVPNKTTYVEGEKFDRTGMVVTATYEDGKTYQVSGYKVEPSGKLAIGNSSVTISYAGKTTTQPINVIKKQLDSIAVIYSWDRSYRAGESFAPGSVQVTATYTNGETKVLNYKDYTATPDPLMEGTTKVTLSYTEDGVTKTTTWPVTVYREAELTSIWVTKNPDKTEYTTGEYFDPTGMVVTATYEDGSTAEVTSYGIDPARPLKMGDSITIAYSEGELGNEIVKTTSFPITVKPGGLLDKLEITNSPKKTEYKEGEEFNYEDMVVMATYTDGTTVEIPWYEYTITPSGPLKKTDTQVTVSYTDDGITKTVSQAITVEEVDTEPFFTPFFTLPGGKVGEAYSQALAVTGKTPITFSLVGNSPLPPGLTISEDGTISGVPSVKGEYTFNVEAKNGKGTTTKLFTITVAPSDITYTMKKFSVSADGIDNPVYPAYGYVLKNETGSHQWGYPTPPAGLFGSEHALFADEACETAVAEDLSDDAAYYLKYTLANKDDDNPVVFTGLTKAKCSLQITGYTTECLRVDFDRFGGKEQAEIVFRVKKIKEYAVRATQEEVVVGPVMVQWDGSYTIPSGEMIGLYNEGAKEIKFSEPELSYDPTDKTANAILTGPDANVFDIKKVSGSYPRTIAADPYSPGSVCKVAVRPAADLEPNRVYTATLTLRTEEGAEAVVPLTLQTEAPEPTGIWMELPDGDVYEYTGKKITPEVKVYWGEKELTKADYTVSYKNNVNVYALKEGDKGFSAAKLPTITIKGKGNYKGSFTRTFEIKPVDLGGSDVTAENIQLHFTGKAIPKSKLVTTVWATLGGQRVKLSAGRDYVYEYGKGYDGLPGTHWVTIKPKSANFVGQRKFTAEIIMNKTPLSKVKFGKIVNLPWEDGTARTQTGLTLKHGSYQLVEGDDYIATYADNKDVGTATITFTGIGPNYFGTVKKTFKITGTSIAGAKFETLSLWVKTFVYDGTEKKQAAGSWKLTLKNGKELDPSTDYEVSYDRNVNPGTAKIIFTGKPEKGLTGTLTKTFTIGGYDVTTGDKIKVYYTAEQEWKPEQAYAPTFPYNLGGVKPEPVVKFDGKVLEKGKDYTVSWSNNAAVKTDFSDGKKIPTVTIRGKGFYKGTITRSFKIETKPFNSSAVTVIASDVNWQNKHGICKPAVMVLENATGKALRAGTNYYAANDKMYPFTYTYVSVPASEKVQFYNKTTRKYEDLASPIIPGTTKVESEHLIPAGTVIEVAIKGKGAYSDAVATAQFKFVKKEVSITGGAFKITIAPQQWTGKPVELTKDDITVTYKVSKTETKTLVLGTDFEIVPGSYLNNVNRGTARVTIRGKNSATAAFGGTKQVTFKIVQRRMNYEITYDKNEDVLRELLWGKLGTEQQDVLKTQWRDELKEQMTKDNGGFAPTDEALNAAFTSEYQAKKKREWFAANYRITGTMKTSSTSYGVALPANAYKLQRYNAKTKKWINVSAVEVEFKGWATKSDRTKEDFANKAPFKPSWLFRLTYDDSVTLYAVW